MLAGKGGGGSVQAGEGQDGMVEQALWLLARPSQPTLLRFLGMPSAQPLPKA